MQIPSHISRNVEDAKKAIHWLKLTFDVDAKASAHPDQDKYRYGIQSSELTFAIEKQVIKFVNVLTSPIDF